MQLKYRGVSYDYKPTPKAEYGPVFAIGAYRGVATAFRQLVTGFAQPVHDLVWRGVHYRSRMTEMVPLSSQELGEGVPAIAAPSTPSAMPEVPALAMAAASAPTLTISDRSRSLLMRHHQRIRRREQSMLARLDEEVGLTAADAARYEGHIQGKPCHDFAGYDRSGAALS